MRASAQPDKTPATENQGTGSRFSDHPANAMDQAGSQASTPTRNTDMMDSRAESASETLGPLRHMTIHHGHCSVHCFEREWLGEQSLESLALPNEVSPDTERDQMANHLPEG